MSLAGFKSQNHPQQTGKRGARNDVDDRGTDQAFFDSLSERFGGFTLDVAAAPHNAKCEDYYTLDDDGLVRPWRGRVWCNPPYSDCGAWVRKAWAEWSADHRPELIVMLLPANRVEQKWWQEYVEPFRDQGPAWTTHLRNGITAEVSRAVNNGEWAHVAAERVEALIKNHEGCRYCSSPLRVEFLRGRMRFDRPGWTPGPKGDRPPFGCCLLIWSRGGAA